MDCLGCLEMKSDNFMDTDNFEMTDSESNTSLMSQPSKSSANGPFAMISAPVAFELGATMTPAVSE